MAEMFVADLEETHAELKQAIVEAQKRYQGLADARRTTAPTFQEGDVIFIPARFIRTTRPSRKLAKHYLGPFLVSEKIGSHSYLVRLPEHLRSIHPVFNVSQLEPTPPSNIPNRINPSPPLIEIDGDLEFKVAQVLDLKWDKHRRDPLLYYVHWAGYKGTVDEFSWLSAVDLQNAGELIVDFHAMNPTKPGPNGVPPKSQ